MYMFEKVSCISLLTTLLTQNSLSYEETKEVLEDILGNMISVFRRRIDVMRLAIGNLTFRKLRSTINRIVALA